MQRIDGLGFVGHVVSTVVTEPYYCSKKTAMDNMWGRECGCGPNNFIYRNMQ